MEIQDIDVVGVIDVDPGDEEMQIQQMAAAMMVKRVLNGDLPIELPGMTGKSKPKNRVIASICLSCGECVDWSEFPGVDTTWICPICGKWTDGE